MSRRATDGTPLPDEFTEDLGELREELREAIRDARAGLQAINRMGGTGTGTSTVSIDAGKGPAWIAASCALAMMVGLILGGGFVGVLLLDQSRRIGAVERDVRDLNDILSAVYVMAPQLKPKEKDK